MVTEFSSSAVEVVILFDIYVPLGKTGMNELEQWFSKWYHEHKDNRGIFFCFWDKAFIEFLILLPQTTE